jgi:hypothetical protein
VNVIDCLAWRFDEQLQPALIGACQGLQGAAVQRNGDDGQMMPPRGTGELFAGKSLPEYSVIVQPVPVTAFG